MNTQNPNINTVFLNHLYEVSIEGKITSHRCKTPRPISPQLNKRGYLQVHLVIDKKQITPRLHQIVATCFHGIRPSPKHEVRHLDGNRLNNHANNLAWGTRLENIHDALNHGTHASILMKTSAYHKQKISQALKGRTKTEQARINMRHPKKPKQNSSPTASQAIASNQGPTGL